MPRERIHGTPAERQAAYRQRQEQEAREALHVTIALIDAAIADRELDDPERAALEATRHALQFLPSSKSLLLLIVGAQRRQRKRKKAERVEAAAVASSAPKVANEYEPLRKCHAFSSVCFGFWSFLLVDTDFGFSSTFLLVRGWNRSITSGSLLLRGRGARKALSIFHHVSFGPHCCGPFVPNHLPVYSVYGFDNVGIYREVRPELRPEDKHICV